MRASILRLAMRGTTLEHRFLPPNRTTGRIIYCGADRIGREARASMTGIEGLHSQQSFFFPGVLQYDPLTVTLWRDAASARAFAYGPGVHKTQMLRQREQNLADRTSFTRCRILRAEGTWHGRNPLDWS